MIKSAALTGFRTLRSRRRRLAIHLPQQLNIEIGVSRSTFADSMLLDRDRGSAEASQARACCNSGDLDNLVV